MKLFYEKFDAHNDHVTERISNKLACFTPTSSMLSSLRSNATRIIPRYMRTLTSGPDPNAHTDAYDLFAKLAGPDALAKEISSPPPPSPEDLLPPIDVGSSEEPIDTFQIIPPAQDPLLHYLASKITHSGKRSQAARRVSRVLMHIHGYTRAQPLPILRQAIFAASPAVRVAIHKRRAKSIPTPMPLNEKQRTRFGVEWILNASEKKPGKSLEIRLAKEMVAVVQGNSEALKKKEEVHRFAMLNRYVWFYAGAGRFLIVIMFR